MNMMLMPISARSCRSSRARLRIASSALLLLFGAFLIAAPAAACPPGHYSIGGGTGGWIGCAPMDGGVGRSSPAGPSIEDMNITAPGLSTYDPQAWQDFFDRMGDQMIEEERRTVPPELRETYEALLRGTWLFGQSRAEDPVPTCKAGFYFRQGGIMFLDWGGPEPGTMFAFFGTNIPRSRHVTRIRVQLEQAGQMQEVEAFHTAHGFRRMGMVMLRVPSTQALISAIEDRQNYRLLMDARELTRSATIYGRMRGRGEPTGRYLEVMRNHWHSGLSARDSLTACLRDQGRLPAALAKAAARR